MSRKFISMLGTGNYSECCYDNGIDKVQTRFIQEAILQMYMKDIREDDEIVIFTTSISEKKNWIDNDLIIEGIHTQISKIKEIDDETNAKINSIVKILDNYNDKIIPRGKKGLYTVLKDNFPQAKIKKIEVNDGKNEEELWDTFDKILNEIHDDDEIIFDITHGFRSIPMQILSVINYAKVIRKNVNLLGVYYGAFEARDKQTNITPIFNLSIYNDILEWTSAADSFISYGNSNQIFDLCLKKFINGHKELEPIKRFAEALKTFTTCIETSRGKIILKEDDMSNSKKFSKSIAASKDNVKSKYEEIVNLDSKNKQPIEPFEMLLDKIKESLENFNNDSNFSVGISTIDWCIKNNMIQNGMVALDETMKTYICNKYSLQDDIKETRDDIVKNAMMYKAIKISKPHKKFYNEKDKEIYELIIRTLPVEIAKLSDKVSNSRNDMSHFGFTQTTTSCNNLKSNLKELTLEFKKIVEKYKNINFIEHKDDKYE